MLESGGQGKLVSLSEPDFFRHLMNIQHKYHRFSNFSNISLDELLLAGFQLQCKLIQSKPHINCYVIKPRSSVIALVPSIARACPFVEHIWNYREPTKTIASYQSFHRMLNVQQKQEQKSLLEKHLSALGLLPPHPVAQVGVETFSSFIPEGDKQGAEVIRRYYYMH